ncbi:MAG: RagB/SusD family nutrient uptake outer membrane protein [Paludibacteraceae bacterium]|nr:RagB/SusD family nutrient uptake outer membrane protein [Paludibacteraceae bacterium]
MKILSNIQQRSVPTLGSATAFQRSVPTSFSAAVFALTALAVIVLTGCKNFLTVNPADSITMDEFYKSEANIRQNTASLYTHKSWQAFAHQFMWIAGDELSGDLYYTYDQEGQFYYMSFGANNSHLTNGWQGLYRVISFANNIINTMPDLARKNGISEDAITRGLAEARCIRGTAYYFLTEYWGDVTIVEDNVKMQSEILHLNTQKSVYQFIVNDLTFAMENLPETDSQAGRATKWSAMGMLAKVYLTMASHLDYEESAQYFAKAKELSGKVISESGLTLYPDYSKLFDIEANNNIESLLAIQCVVAGYGYGNAHNCNWSRTSCADQAWGDGKGPTIDLQKQYEEGDLRRQWVYMSEGDYYPDINKADGGYTYHICVIDEQGNELESANEMLAHMKKYCIGRAADCNGGVGDQQDAANNVYLLRLADVYMVYVEATMGATEQTTDQLALDLYNKIRSRAGLEADADNIITYDELIHERRCEFAFEGINFFDIKRMFYRDKQKAITYLNGMQREQGYYNSDSSKKTSKDGYTLNLSRSPIRVTESQMILPVPGSELTAMPSLAEPAVDYFNK